MTTDESAPPLKRRSLLRAAAVTSVSVSVGGCITINEGIDIRFGTDDDSPEADTEDGSTADTSNDGSTDESGQQETDGDSDDADNDAGGDEGEHGEDADEDDLEETADENDPPPSFEEDCTSFDPDNLRVVRARVEDSDGGWKNVTRVKDDAHQLLEFDAFSDATSAREIIEFYGFDRYCSVSSPDSVMTYWLVDGQPATLSRTPFKEDCIPVDHTNLTVEQTAGGEWRLTEGTSRLMTDSDEEAIRTAKAIIEHYEFSRHCFVGRPNPPMTYWLAEANGQSR